MEGALAMSLKTVFQCQVSGVRQSRQSAERGQSIILFALLVPLAVLFLLGVMDYMLTTGRLMETIAAADLAAHAGAQQIKLQPDGDIEPDYPLGTSVARSFFAAQAPEYTRVSTVTCAIYQNRPGCRVRVQVQSAGILIPQRWITVTSIGYLEYGVTRPQQ